MSISNVFILYITPMQLIDFYLMWGLKLDLLKFKFYFFFSNTKIKIGFD